VVVLPVLLGLRNLWIFFWVMFRLSLLRVLVWLKFLIRLMMLMTVGVLLEGVSTVLR